MLDEQTQKALYHSYDAVRLEPFATKPAVMKANGEIEGVVLKGIDEGYDQRFLKSILTAGDTIDFTDSTAAVQQILLSAHIANRMQLKVGDGFLMYFIGEQIRPRKFRVTGIYSMGVEEVDKLYVIGSMGMIRRLNDWDPALVGGYEITLNDFGKAGEAGSRLSAELREGLAAEPVRNQYPEVFQWLDLLDVNAQIILILMVVVAVINMISALLIMILERTRMIGILKALGMRTISIQKVFLYHAAYLIVVGLALGNALGLGLYFFQQQTRFFKLDEAAYYISYVPVSVTGTDILLLNTGLMVICLLVLLIPSGLVGRISPIKAIRWS